MASKVSIANQALSWLGANLITAFTDNSVEASVVSANYDGVRDAVLEDRAWTFATRRVILNPVLTPPPFGYAYTFTYPADVLRILTVRDDGKNSGPSSLEWALEDKRILSNSNKIYVRYIATADNPLSYSPGFVQALAARLAADMAIPLTESRSLQQDMWGLYQKKLADARTIDGMQGRAQRVGKGRWNVIRGTGTGNIGPYV